MTTAPKKTATKKPARKPRSKSRIAAAHAEASRRFNEEKAYTGVLADIASGIRLAVALKRRKIKRSAFYRLVLDPDRRALFDKALEERDFFRKLEHEDEMEERAMLGREFSVVSRGKVVGKERHPSDMLLKHLFVVDHPELNVQNVRMEQVESIDAVLARIEAETVAGQPTPEPAAPPGGKGPDDG